MTIHWTVLSERVKNLGDLINFFEALDHPIPAAIASRVPERSNGKRSGYSVDFGNGSGIDPHSDTTAGLKRIITFVEREYETGLSLDALRKIRGRVSCTLHIDITAVNNLSLSRVVEVLTETDEGGSDASTHATSQFRWLKVSQVARVFSLNAPQVSKLADNETFITNGQTGPDRCIDVVSVVAWVLDRLQRQDASDSTGG